MNHSRPILYSPKQGTIKERLAEALLIDDPKSVTLNNMIESAAHLRDRMNDMLSTLQDYPDIEKTAEQFDRFHHELIVLLDLPGCPSLEETMNAVRKKLNACNKSQTQINR